MYIYTSRYKNVGMYVRVCMYVRFLVVRLWVCWCVCIHIHAYILLALILSHPTLSAPARYTFSPCTLT